MIKVHVTKSEELDDDIVKELLNTFIDWVDDNGLLREGSDKVTFQYNAELVSTFIFQNRTDV